MEPTTFIPCSPSPVQLNIFPRHLQHCSVFPITFYARLRPIRRIRARATTKSPTQLSSSASSAESGNDLPSDNIPINNTSSSSDTINVDVEASDDTTEAVKSELLQRLVGLNRGFIGDNDIRKQVRDLVEVLEGNHNQVVKLDKIIGNWKLLWTDGIDILSLCVLPGVQIGDVYQNVTEKRKSNNNEEYVIENIVDLESKFAPLLNPLFGSSVAKIKVSATGTVKKVTDNDEKNRIDITFNRTAFVPSTLLGNDISQTLPPLSVPLQSSVGFIKTTFIDNSLRIARAPRTPRSENASTIFILLREKE